MISARLPGLDLLRAAAVLLVVAAHAVQVPAAVGLRWAGGFRICGPLGVDLFFALSGFLIGGILIETGDRLRHGRELARFWASRWLRTLPNFYLFLVINVALWTWVYVHPRMPWGEIGRTAIFSQNLWHGPGWFFMEAWSLSVEEWFYLLLPLGLWLGLHAGLGFFSALKLMLVLMLAGPLVSRWLAHPPGDWGLEVHMVVLHKLDAIGWGVAAAWLSRRWPEKWRAWARPLAVVSGLLLLECVVFALRPDFGRQWFTRVLFPSVQPLGFALLLPWASQWTGWKSRTAQSVTLHLALWSYSLYLVNYSVYIVTATDLVPRLGAAPAKLALAVALATVVSLAVAAAVYRWFELPILRLRSQLLAEKKTEARPPAVPALEPS